MKQKIDWLKKFLPFIAIFVLGLVPIIWFWGRGNVLINGVDTNFPLNPTIWFLRRIYVWNDIVNGGIDFSSSTAGVFFHLIQVIPYLLGLKIQFVEISNLIFWFCLIVFSSFFLARVILPKRFLPQLLFTVFYAFNIYLFNSWENVKVANLSLVSGIPLGLGILMLLDKGKITRKYSLLLSVFTGFILLGTGINPSYFCCFLLVIFIYFSAVFISSPGARLLKVKNLVSVLSVIVLVNMFWILPTSNYIIKTIPTAASINKIGFTDWTDSLSENTSIFNIIRLQGAWDWYSIDSASGLPLYIPYALNYFHSLPFIVFSLIAPILSIFSLIFKKKTDKHLYLAFSLMFFLGVFLDCGTHAPTGIIFRFLLDHLPFFSLFRSPWYIFTPLITLSSAGLIALFFDKCLEQVSGKVNHVSQVLLNLGGVVLILGNFLYCYPLITGKIFRPARPDGFFISFPNYIYDAAGWLNHKNGDGRVIGYPDDEIENFDWGYRGIESILQLVANKEVLFSSLNSTESPINLLIKQFYAFFKKQQFDAALKIAAKLNASTIFEKNDQMSLSPKIPTDFKKTFESVTFGQWSFYDLAGGGSPRKISTASNFVFTYPYEKSSLALSVLDRAEHVLNSADSEVEKIPQVLNTVGSVVMATNLLTETFRNFTNTPSILLNRLVAQDLSQARFDFNMTSDGVYQPVLEKYRLSDFGLTSIGNIQARLDERTVTLEFETANDSFVFYKPILLTKGYHVLAFSLRVDDSVSGGDFESGVTFAKSENDNSRADYQIVKGESGHYLSFTNFGKTDASAAFTVANFDPYVPYYIEVKYKQIYGGNGGVLPEQVKSTTMIKAQAEGLPRYPEWETFSIYYDPVKTDSEMKVSLTTQSTSDPLGTKILYDDLVVYKIFTNNLIFIKKGVGSLITPEVSYKQISPVLYQGEISQAIGPHAIIFSENYSPEWQLTVYDERGQKITTQPQHFSVDTYANGWFMENLPLNYRFSIYYRPQSWYVLGLVISGLTFLVILGLFVIRKNES